jgi:predicted metallo-beta-lactamase superfamily hydrolase
VKKSIKPKQIKLYFDREIRGVTRFAYNLYENAIKSNDDLYKNRMIFLNGEQGFAKGSQRRETRRKLIGIY